MNRLAIALSLPIGAAVLLQANPSQAFTVVNVNGTDYDVELFEGSLADFQLSGLNLPWFNDIGLATDFANAYTAVDNSAINLVNGPDGDAQLGPLFYTLSTPDPDIFVAWNNGNNAPNYDSTPFTGQYTCDLGVEYDCTPTYLQWAYANPSPNARVPAPLPLLGATTAFSFSRKLRRRLSAQKFTF
jgi:hypothetical protein